MSFEHGPSKPRTAPGAKAIPTRISLGPYFHTTEICPITRPDKVVPIQYLQLQGEVDGMYRFTIQALTKDFVPVTLTGYLNAATILHATLDGPLPDDLLIEDMT